ncbi:hypothetical protein JOC75_001966 [Metabacillus crassostreae]|nr:hypothetical protein [Metabacillus crassostreae]MBM7603993.1 hypothetical protein [Metabacillus crassostreae]
MRKNERMVEKKRSMVDKMHLIVGKKLVDAQKWKNGRKEEEYGR